MTTTARQRLLGLVEPQRAARVARPDRPRLKVNLYTALETRAAARAARTLAAEGPPPGIDCLMVGDSYLMTHLGRPSTRLDTPAEEAGALDLLVGLVAEVRRALDGEDWPGQPPWLLGDLPDGAAASLGRAEAAAGRMAAAGAEALKVELGGPESWAVLEGLARRGEAVVAHLGYAPQKTTNRRYGGDLAEAAALFAAARRARDAGAVAIVLERVDPAVHARLAAPAPGGLPVYAIFSGAAPNTAQNLNVWDAVVRPDTPRHAFPPTAVLDRADVPAGYTEDLIADRLAALVRLALAGRYPEQRTALDDETREALSALPVWGA